MTTWSSRRRWPRPAAPQGPAFLTATAARSRGTGTTDISNGLVDMRLQVAAATGVEYPIDFCLTHVGDGTGPGVLGHAKRVKVELRFAEPLGKGDAEVVFRFDREMGNLAQDFVLVSWPGGSERVPANGKQVTLKIPADASARKTVFVGGDTLLFARCVARRHFS